MDNNTLDHDAAQRSLHTTRPAESRTLTSTINLNAALDCTTSELGPLNITSEEIDPRRQPNKVDRMNMDAQSSYLPASPHSDPNPDVIRSPVPGQLDELHILEPAIGTVGEAVKSTSRSKGDRGLGVMPFAATSLAQPQPPQAPKPSIHSASPARRSYGRLNCNGTNTFPLPADECPGFAGALTSIHASGGTNIRTNDGVWHLQSIGRDQTRSSIAQEANMGYGSASTKPFAASGAIAPLSPHTYALHSERQCRLPNPIGDQVRNDRLGAESPNTLTLERGLIVSVQAQGYQNPASVPGTNSLESAEHSVFQVNHTTVPGGRAVTSPPQIMLDEVSGVVSDSSPNSASSTSGDFASFGNLIISQLRKAIGEAASFVPPVLHSSAFSSCTPATVANPNIPSTGPPKDLMRSASHPSMRSFPNFRSLSQSSGASPVDAPFYTPFSTPSGVHPSVHPFGKYTPPMPALVDSYLPSPTQYPGRGLISPCNLAAPSPWSSSSLLSTASISSIDITDCPSSSALSAAEYGYSNIDDEMESVGSARDTIVVQPQGTSAPQAMHYRSRADSNNSRHSQRKRAPKPLPNASNGLNSAATGGSNAREGGTPYPYEDQESMDTSSTSIEAFSDSDSLSDFFDDDRGKEGIRVSKQNYMHTGNISRAENYSESVEITSSNNRPAMTINMPSSYTGGGNLHRSEVPTAGQGDHEQSVNETRSATFMDTAEVPFTTQRLNLYVNTTLHMLENNSTVPSPPIRASASDIVDHLSVSNSTNQQSTNVSDAHSASRHEGKEVEIINNDNEVITDPAAATTQHSDVETTANRDGSAELDLESIGENPVPSEAEPVNPLIQALPYYLSQTYVSHQPPVLLQHFNGLRFSPERFHDTAQQPPPDTDPTDSPRNMNPNSFEPRIFTTYHTSAPLPSPSHFFPNYPIFKDPPPSGRSIRTTALRSSRSHSASSMDQDYTFPLDIDVTIPQFLPQSPTSPNYNPYIPILPEDSPRYDEFDTDDPRDLEHSHRGQFYVSTNNLPNGHSLSSQCTQVTTPLANMATRDGKNNNPPPLQRRESVGRAPVRTIKKNLSERLVLIPSERRERWRNLGIVSGQEHDNNNVQPNAQSGRDIANGNSHGTTCESGPAECTRRFGRLQLHPLSTNFTLATVPSGSPSPNLSSDDASPFPWQIFRYEAQPSPISVATPSSMHSPIITRDHRSFSSSSLSASSSPVQLPQNGHEPLSPHRQTTITASINVESSNSTTNTNSQSSPDITNDNFPSSE